ncbi:MAG: ABC transporter substrate-binding protein [Candidatus Paracaedibacteraceae bacterium]|nr:ABC transporter substrate-binding protein [Candidatus Paracaedibacteraceae bacterium]
MKKITKIIALFAVMISTAYCINSKSFIQDLGNRAIQILTNSNDSLEQVEDHFVVLLDEGFDVSHIANFVMGRHWKSENATPEQRQKQKDRFTTIFKIRLKKAYASRFREYRGVKFEVGEVRQRAGADFVKSTIQKPGGPKTDVEWRVRSGKVQDVIVDGISMSVTLRDDYSSLLSQKKGNIEEFLKALEAKN